MQLYSRRVILASASPRRRALLEAACYEVEVRVPRADESWPGGDVETGSISLARRKLQLVGEMDELALAADTVVVIGDRRLGKPATVEDARAMLRLLAGRPHRVVTGFAVSRGQSRREAAVTSHVWFRRLSELEIERYIESGEPFDKAGSYAIQGRAGSFVDRVEGSYTNIVGLPMTEVLDALERLS